MPKDYEKESKDFNKLEKLISEEENKESRKLKGLNKLISNESDEKEGNNNIGEKKYFGGKAKLRLLLPEFIIKELNYQRDSVYNSVNNHIGAYFQLSDEPYFQLSDENSMDDQSSQKKIQWMISQVKKKFNG